MPGWHGIYPVLYAFWDAHDRLDRAAMAIQVEHCIAAGAQGITVLGLVTEVHKMDVNERLALVEMAGDLIAGRVPYAVTVAEPSIPGQIAFARAAARFGADWVILQPPTSGGQEDVIRHFGAVADAIDIEVAVQNNPVNLATALSTAGLVELNRRHPNIALLKGEGFSVDIQQAIEGSGGAYRVFGGHGGIEFPALLRSGGVGLIPAPDFLAPQVAIYRLWNEGGKEGQENSERIHRAILPAVVFMSRSVPAMLCYGKRLFARQSGIDFIRDRAPALTPTAFGLSETMQLQVEIFAASASATSGEKGVTSLLHL